MSRAALTGEGKIGSEVLSHMSTSARIPAEPHGQAFFNLRVLLRYDETYDVHVAHCIETGNLVTADSSQDACRMIKELLEDEIFFALRKRNLKNLFSSPAPLEVLVQWLNAAQEKDPDTVYLDVDFKQAELREIEPKNTNLRNRVEIVRAA
jgi:hypothetical protein